MNMGKARNASLDEQLANASIKRLITADEQLEKQSSEAGQDASNALVEETRPLTPEHVEDVIDGIMTAAFGAFYEPQHRVVANNGKAYPVEFDFEARELKNEDGSLVESTGEIITVDRYGYLNKGLARSVCSGLEMMLRTQSQNCEQQRKRIGNELRFGHNRGVDVTAKVERMADFLGAMVEQEAFLQIALNRAFECYKRLTGEVYPSREDREQAVAARKDEIKADPALSSKLASLGVTL
jgi:hypothetical protein